MTFSVVFVVFPGVTQLDLTAPAHVLARLPDADLRVVSETGAAVATDCGFSILPTTSFGSAPQADLLCVPGGGGVADAVADGAIIAFLSQQGQSARIITSVCTGAFLLGAAGLLQGRKATTHWAYTDLLPMVGARHEPGRVVVDGPVITGGGVTAGLDFGLTVAAEVAGPETAQAIQLGMEYDPAPPFRSGRPEQAPQAVRDRIAPWYDRARARLRAGLEGPTIT